MNRIEKCKEVYEELFSGEPADIKSGTDSELMIILQRFTNVPRFLTEVCFGHFYTRGVLSIREESCLCCHGTVSAVYRVSGSIQCNQYNKIGRMER